MGTVAVTENIAVCPACSKNIIC